MFRWLNRERERAVVLSVIRTSPEQTGAHGHHLCEAGERGGDCARSRALHRCLYFYSLAVRLRDYSLNRERGVFTLSSSSCLPAGDRIVKVNGESIIGKTYSQVIAVIQNR